MGISNKGLVADPVGDDLDLDAEPARAILAKVRRNLDFGITGHFFTLLPGDSSEGA
jgi:hypothetical protein